MQHARETRLEWVVSVHHRVAHTSLARWRAPQTKELKFDSTITFSIHFCSLIAETDASIGPILSTDVKGTPLLLRNGTDTLCLELLPDSLCLSAQPPRDEFSPSIWPTGNSKVWQTRYLRVTKSVLGFNWVLIIMNLNRCSVLHIDIRNFWWETRYACSDIWRSLTFSLWWSAQWPCLLTVGPVCFPDSLVFFLFFLFSPSTPP